MMSKTTLKADEKGFVAMGTGGFYPAQFDNFEIHSGKIFFCFFSFFILIYANIFTPAT